MSSPGGAHPTLIFIPDISGFTTFINEVEVDHSAHIITELLEIIIKSNILNLKVSEIEGDAVLFYRTGAAPSFEEIASQAEVMFLEFHRHLKLYERDRICQCGACSTAQKLSLKFVYHFGTATIGKINNTEKLLGPDVTLAHRLLKNNIEGQEYVLYSSRLQQTPGKSVPGWIQIREGEMTYKGIGQVGFSYYSISSLKEKVSELPPQTAPGKDKHAVSASVTVGAPIKQIHQILTNVALKPEWIVGLKSVEEKGNHLERVGSEHQCITSNATLEIEITSQKTEDGVIEYVEKTNNIKRLSPLYVFYLLESISANETRIEMSIQYKQSILSRLYIDFPLRMICGSI